MTKPNPLLEDGLPIPFHRIGADDVRPGVRDILQRGQQAVDELAAGDGVPGWDDTIRRLDDITREVDERLTVVSHLLSVAETPELREAYNDVLSEITGFWSRLPLNEALWKRIKTYADTPEAKNLEGLRARHLEKTLREFRRAGADLSPDGKGRLEEIRLELARLSRKFSENVLDATATWELHLTDENRLEGIPEGPKRRFREAAREKDLEGWILTLDFPSYEAVMKHAVDRDLRRHVQEAYMGRCRDGEFDNLPLIPRILALRQEMARILGHRDFPDYRLENAMVKTGEAALAFEAELTERTRPYWEADLEELRRHALELGMAELMPWDVSFVAESLRMERFEIDDEILRPYFPLPQVLEGLFETVRRVFGLTVERVDRDEVWHPDVRYYELRDEEGTLLGSFYTDWFPRKEKREGAWMNGFRTGGPKPGGSFRPHVGFVAGNFSPPDGEVPALLTHREVRTVFHEFGHLLHHLTSRVTIPGRAGLNVAWDWVELPSQIMENWTWEEESLDLFARHFETGEPLPGRLLDRMVAARRFMGGWSQMRQLSFGTLDLALHGDLAPRLMDDDPGSGPSGGAGETVRDPDRDGEPPETGASETPYTPDLLAFAEERMEPFSPTPIFARSHPLSTFTHLFSGGYAAGYYSYLWSEVLDADAFTRFLEEGVLNPATGRAFLDAILSRGDSAEPEELFREFMGREPDPEALVRRNLGPLPG